MVRLLVDAKNYGHVSRKNYNSQLEIHGTAYKNQNHWKLPNRLFKQFAAVNSHCLIMQTIQIFKWIQLKWRLLHWKWFQAVRFIMNFIASPHSELQCWKRLMNAARKWLKIYASVDQIEKENNLKDGIYEYIR